MICYIQAATRKTAVVYQLRPSSDIGRISSLVFIWQTEFKAAVLHLKLTLHYSQPMVRALGKYMHDIPHIHSEV